MPRHASSVGWPTLPVPLDRRYVTTIEVSRVVDERHHGWCYVDGIALGAGKFVDEGKAGKRVCHADRPGGTSSGKPCVGYASKKDLEAVQTTSIPIGRPFDALS